MLAKQDIEMEWIFFREVFTMSAISNEQRKRDEESVAAFLIFFNMALFGAFLVVCAYQSFK